MCIMLDTHTTDLVLRYSLKLQKSLHILTDPIKGNTINL